MGICDLALRETAELEFNAIWNRKDAKSAKKTI
jgi:hypothetical protein